MDSIREKLFFQSTHRGTKECDDILGGFAKKYLAHLTEKEIEIYEQFLHFSDHEILSWMQQKDIPPIFAACPIFRKIKSYTRTERPIPLIPLQPRSKLDGTGWLDESVCQREE